MLFCIVHFLFTVNKATKVRILALTTEVEGAAIISKLLRIPVVNVTSCFDSWIIKYALCTCTIHCLSLYTIFQTHERPEHLSDRFRENVRGSDLLFAAWAGPEGEGDSQGRPFMLEELNDAVCVESMSTS